MPLIFTKSLHLVLHRSRLKGHYRNSNGENWKPDCRQSSALLPKSLRKRKCLAERNFSHLRSRDYRQNRVFSTLLERKWKERKPVMWILLGTKIWLVWPRHYESGMTPAGSKERHYEKCRTPVYSSVNGTCEENAKQTYQLYSTFWNIPHQHIYFYGFREDRVITAAMWSTRQIFPSQLKRCVTGSPNLLEPLPRYIDFVEFWLQKVFKHRSL